MEQLAQLHVVSDLHLGGPTGRQTCDQGPALGALIDHVGQLEPAARVGLVLNGDVVDFLAAEGARYLDPAGAVEKLQRVFADPLFQPVWDALRRFTAIPGRVLVLVLGNHDVELALPHVQEALLARICADETARGRVRIAMDGTGWACLVGGRRVLCTHGNEVDTWNFVDQTALRVVSRALNEGADPKPWEPNAGTKLVIDVMNAIKQKYPLVDLLQPEGTAVPAVVFALAPAEVKGPLTDAAPILLHKVRDWVLMKASGVLGADAGAPADATPTGDAALSTLLAGKRAAPPAGAADDPLAGQAALFSSIAAGGASAPAGAGGTLGGLDVPLRVALAHWVGSDKSFDVDAPDDTFSQLDQLVAPTVDFLVAGHTHLERALPRKQGGYYYNSGTWIRLLRLTEAMLADEASFAPVLDVFRAGTMAALDTIAGLVVRRNTVVSIVASGGNVQGSLGHASLDGGAFSVQPVDGSVFSLAVQP